MTLQEFAKEALKVVVPFHSQMMRRMPKEFSHNNITMPQLAVLGLVQMKRGCTMGEISKTIGITKSAATGLADRLIKTGFVKRIRSDDDRRVVKIEVTQKGVNFARKFNHYRLKMLSEFFACINEKERMAYLGILKKIQKGFTKKTRYEGK